jgi:Kef-type K+ transport system membrane component KefB
MLTAIPFFAVSIPAEAIMSPLLVFILECAMLVAIPMVAWRYLGLRRITPLAVVQIVVGLALGPSILGRLAPDIQQILFPDENVAKLSGVATLGVVIFAFLSGMHLDDKMARIARPASLAIAVGSFFVPLVLGAGLGYWLAIADPALIGPKAEAWEFSSGFGICIAVTALPVLTSLLKEMGIIDSDLGQQALGCAAMNDAALWAIVSLLLVMVAGSQAGDAWHVLWIPAYLLAMLFLVPWLMQRLLARAGSENDDTILVLACVAGLCSSLVSEYAGLGYLLGAFLGGVAMPHAVRAPLIRRLDWSTTLLFMPFFYMTTGLRTDADLASASLIGIVAAATAVAIFGKTAGVAVPSILMGEPWRRSLALGTLLQSKGLMEVLVITVLADAGIVSTQVFSVLILVAVICTTAAMPLTYLAAGGKRTRAGVIGYRTPEAQEGTLFPPLVGSNS